tara:strand:- start:270 stop:527 length:258 start_codon:yes stop_codon:yes gene_type:complete
MKLLDSLSVFFASVDIFSQNFEFSIISLERDVTAEQFMPPSISLCRGAVCHYTKDYCRVLQEREGHFTRIRRGWLLPHWRRGGDV